MELIDKNICLRCLPAMPLSQHITKQYMCRHIKIMKVYYTDTLIGQRYQLGLTKYICADT